MAAKASQLPWMKFWKANWKNDPKLGQCAPATRAIWLDLCITMDDMREGEISGTPEQLSRVARCSPAELLTAARELIDETGAADGFVEPDFVLFVSRRLSREYGRRNGAKSRAKASRERKNEQQRALSVRGTYPGSSQTEERGEKREDGEERGDPPLPPEPGGLFGDDLELVDPPPDPLTSMTRELLAELNNARMSCLSDARALRPIEENLKFIRARLESGCTPEEIRHVIAVCAAEVRVKPQAGNWFNAQSPFRPENFQRLLARTVSVASMTDKPPPRRAMPTAAEVLAERERIDREHRAELRRENEAQGYRYVDRPDGGVDIYDPDGHLLDEKGRPIVEGRS